MIRPDWDLYFIRIAKEVASRSTCPRAMVGAVIVKDNTIISTGYNGAPAGEPHCTDKGCIIENDHCVRVVHAEINALLYALKNGASVEGATLYYWDSKGRYAQTMEDFAALFPEQASTIKSFGIARICGRGL